MSINNRDLVLSVLRENISLSNSSIARLLVKKYPKEFEGKMIDSIRRYVSKLRKKNKLFSTKITSNDFSIKQDGKDANIVAVSQKRIQSLEELIEFFKIDLNKWTIKKWECSSYESHTNIKQYEVDGKVHTEHKVVPLYRVWAQLQENRPLILLNDIKLEIIKELKEYSPKIQKINYNKQDTKRKPCLLEINIFDLHFGKLAWNEETGVNYDIKIAREVFFTCLFQLLEQSKNYNIEKILFPVGNDFFNVDNKLNTTSAGTPQDEDTRWKKTFKLGRQLIIDAIEHLRQIAPVDVLIVPGNHDVERIFYLGDALECFYHKCDDVKIDNGAKVRKYYRYGKCLIGYTHGRDEKIYELPHIMASEEPILWANTKYREWHLGEIHHKKEIKWISTEEFKGVTVRFMRSLAGTDAWHYSKGYISALRAGEGFIWDKENGLICQFTASI
jgi:hypothetical protein